MTSNLILSQWHEHNKYLQLGVYVTAAALKVVVQSTASTEHQEVGRSLLLHALGPGSEVRPIGKLQTGTNDTRVQFSSKWRTLTSTC